MKLLLTSAGFTNKSIITSAEHLTGKPLNEQALAFVPTAANVEAGDKDWLIDDLVRCKKLFASVDIVDISAVPQDIWQPRLEAAQVLLFGGGNTFHLMYWLDKSGLAKLLPKMLETKVYVGISAGSMVATSNMAMSQSARLYSETYGELMGDQGLGFVNFHVRPHLNSQYFPKVRAEFLEATAKELPEPIYALDDQSAIQVIDGQVTVISEGQYLAYNLPK